MATHTVSDIINIKQRSDVLTEDQIQWFIDGILNGDIHDAQIGAFLMAVFLNGMSEEETAALTKIMMKSGEVLTWPEEWKDFVVDKHSTGGVGDKISLILAPAIAACGLKIPMISGRSLGFTGGTLDKLESIPGFNVNLSTDQMRQIIDQVGCCIVGQTAKLVPADKKLYSLRDITNTVGSTPLIVSSIVSKKAAEGPKSLVLDVKYGKGCYQKTVADGQRLANLMVSTGQNLGVNTSAIISNMDCPLGFAVGNSLEVMESVELLQGKGPSDIIELVVTQGGELLRLNKKVPTFEEGKAMIEEVLQNGKALEKFKQMLIAQGVTKENAEKVCQQPLDVLPLSSNKTVLYSKESGFVDSIDALACGEVSFKLGAGRTVPTDDVTLNTGLHLSVAQGSSLKEGQPWVTVYHVQERLADDLKEKLENALSVVKDKIENIPRTHSIIRGDDAHKSIFVSQ